MSISDDVYKIMHQNIHRQWKIDGRLAQPTQNDVSRLMAAMVSDVRSMGYDSIESGGILVKRDGNMIDVYVHVGEIDATDNSI